MILSPARYLLRFDDLCPAMAADRWTPFQSLIEEFHLQPILAVVPDNRDPELDLSPPDPAFWPRMRALEAAGAIVGLHGYRHLCASYGRSLLALARSSEFAGVPAQTQRAWIADGLRILRDRGLNPRIWVAPRHGFDAHTLVALRAAGIPLVSDGFARRPHLRGGLIWIPQQLWGPVDKPSGLWTICIHSNTARHADIDALRQFLITHAGQFTSVDKILFLSHPAALTPAESLFAQAASRSRRLSSAFRRFRHASLSRQSSSS
ncbi:MAG: DUF2334 domain-containing protein [Terracidiphilus sp.]|jgi:predicted deacetylase